MIGARSMWFQITAGTGPVECAWAVVQVLDRLRAEASAAGLECEVIEMAPGPAPGSATSVLIEVAGGAELEGFARSWQGTVQWIARSPFRPAHKRKNWFVGVDGIEPVSETRFDARDVRWETMRASGPGGQHVNRTESAVRVTHVPTGVQAMAMEERSQHRNRKLAMARLVRKLEERDARAQEDARSRRRQAHYELERGNPVRVLRGE